MFLDILILSLALIGVVKGAEWFLRSAEKIGIALRLSPFILGVVLVGFGTSLPELATSLAAVFKGVDTVTLANVAGSNIANTLVILGITVITLGTIRFKKNLIDLDIPLLIAVTAFFSLLLVDGSIDRTDGFLLLIGFAGYMVYAIGYNESREHHRGLISLIAALTKVKKSKVEKYQNHVGPLMVLLLLFSVTLLGFSSKIAIDSLLRIVERVDVGVDVLSFFALAIGTSLPELVVSYKALKKGQGDIVVGGIIGSSMFNMLLIGGVAGVILPQHINPELVGWTITGLALSSLVLMVGSISKRIHIWEGMMYILIYVALAEKILQV
jgi:cation:H+ antiporter